MSRALGNKVAGTLFLAGELLTPGGFLLGLWGFAAAGAALAACVAVCLVVMYSEGPCTSYSS